MSKVNIKPIKAGDMPPALRCIWNISPEKTRVTNMLVALICYCTLATRLRVRYKFDFGLHMLVANLLVIGPSGCGKSIVRWVVDFILTSLQERDQTERRKEQDYKDMCRKMGKNTKDLPDEPLTVVRFMQNITIPKLVKRADFMVRRYGEPLSFFIFADELATLTKGSGRQRDEMEAVGRTAYMLGEKYIRETLYQDGYNAMVDINWSSVLCGQEYALSRYITDSSITGGDASRNIIVRLDGELGDDAPVLKAMTDEEKALIASTVNRLMNETYTEDDKLQPTREVDMRWLDKDVDRWCDAQREIIVKGGDMAHDSFYKRSSSTAFRLATMFYYLWGEKQEAQKHTRRFYYWAAQFILDGQLGQWGKRYNELQLKASGKDKEEKKPTLYDQLPKRFTRDQVNMLVEQLELGTAARQFIHRWLKIKKWIVAVEADVYEKKY